MDFTHIIFTRFNIYNPAWSVVVDDRWLRRRVSLFEQICLPSVLPQLHSSSLWFLLFDSSYTPLWLQEYGLDLERRDRRIHALFVPRAPVTWSETIENFTTGPIVTTRLDSDDALAVDFVTELRVAVLPQREVINFELGVLLQRDSSRLYISDVPNQFTSLVELSPPFLTIQEAGEHGSLKRQASVRSITTSSPMWAWCIHNAGASQMLQRLDSPVFQTRLRGVIPPEVVYRRFPHSDFSLL